MTGLDPASYVPSIYTADPSADDGVDPDPPPYSGRPRGIQPGAVEVALTLGESEQAAVLLTTVKAYPSGVSMMVSCHLKDPVASDDIGDPISDGRLTLTIDLPDGQQLGGTDPLSEYEHPNAQRLRPYQPADDDWVPDHAVLRRAGGGGGGSLFEQEYWLWPLPITGRLRVSCQWPEQGITTSRELEAQLFHDAAAQARLVRYERIVGPASGDRAVR